VGEEKQIGSGDEGANSRIPALRIQEKSHPLAIYRDILHERKNRENSR
jgi:hypothetical protein